MYLIKTSARNYVNAESITEVFERENGELLLTTISVEEAVTVEKSYVKQFLDELQMINKNVYSNVTEWG